VQDLVISQLATILKIPAEQILEKTNLWELGIDSLTLLSLLSSLREILHLKLSTGDVLSVTTVRSLILVIMIGLLRSTKGQEDLDL